MKTYLHEEDLPKDVKFGHELAVDTEAMGLNIHRDRLCLIQMSDDGKNVHIVRFKPGSDFSAPRLKNVLVDDTITKIFHFARFDVATIKKYMGITVNPIYCTKIASKFIRTYTDSHGLKTLCNEMLDVNLNKQQQSSDWGKDKLSQQQMAYAASDVLHLHNLKNVLDSMLEREGRTELAKQCFNFMNTVTDLDLLGWNGATIFEH